MDHFMYLPPGGDSLEKYAVDKPPPIAPKATRFVCISDSHNEHRQLKLPWGHVLVHCGDILTASGDRYVKRDQARNITHLDPKGPKLVENFANWLGSLSHPHQVIIGGNHDLVVEAMGTDAVRTLFAKKSQGRAVYLCNENASVGTLNVFGSPHAHWGGFNDAFLRKDWDYDEMEERTHVMLTHMPAVLPERGGGQREDRAMASAFARCRPLLHVSGHCHWAHGAYQSQGVPCVVASVCEAKWRKYKELKSIPGGKRGDKLGDSRGGSMGKISSAGGYNIFFPPIVCDILIPGGPPKEEDVWNVSQKVPNVHVPMDIAGEQEKAQAEQQKEAEKPKLLFFAATTDPGTARRLVPLLQHAWKVRVFESATEALHAVKEDGANFTCAVAKLGSEDNHCWDLLRALQRDTKMPIVVHSATACRSERIARKLHDAFSNVLICNRTTEGAMVKQLEKISESSAVCRPMTAMT